jgi:hypothetical protein
VLGGAAEQLLVVLDGRTGRSVRVLLGGACLFETYRAVHQRLGQEQREEAGGKTGRPARREGASEQGENRC